MFGGLATASDRHSFWLSDGGKSQLKKLAEFYQSEDEQLLEHLRRLCSTSDVPRVREHVLMLYHLIPHIQETHPHSSFVSAFLKLVRSFTLVRFVCMEVGLIEDCIRRLDGLANSDVLFKPYVSILQTLGSFHIPPKDLKAVFRLLHSKENEHGEVKVPSGWHDILHAVSAMARQRSEPPAYFYLGGNSTGFSVPQLQHWPHSNSYSFCVWMCPNSERVSSCPHSDRFYLFGFANGNGQGVSAFLRNGQLVVEVNHKGHKVDTAVCTRHSFMDGVWVHVACTHEHFRFSRSQLTVLVNGNEIEQIPLRYPSIPGALDRNTLFACAGETLAGNTDFAGDVAGMALFDKALPTPILVDMMRAGPRYLVMHHTSPYKNSPFANIPEHLRDKTLLSRMFLNIHPFAVLPNSSAVANGNGTAYRNHVNPTNTRLEGEVFVAHPAITAVFPCPATQSLHSLGGIVCLFQLFDQLGQMPVGLDGGDACATALCVLRDFLLSSGLNMRQFDEAGGFEAIAYVLGTLPPHHLAPSTVHALGDIWESVGMLLPAKQRDALARDVLFNLRLWSVASYGTLSHLLEVLLAMVVSANQKARNTNGPGAQRKANSPAFAVSYFRHVVTVQRLLDHMRDCLVFSSSDNDDASQSTSLPHTAQPQLTPSELREIRSKVLRVATAMAGENLSILEFSAYIRYAHSCADDEQLVDVLHILLNWLCRTLPVAEFHHSVSLASNDIQTSTTPLSSRRAESFSESPNNNSSGTNDNNGSSLEMHVLQHIVDMGGLDVLLPLCERPHHAVRSLAIKLCGVLFHCIVSRQGKPSSASQWDAFALAVANKRWDSQSYDSILECVLGYITPTVTPLRVWADVGKGGSSAHLVLCDSSPSDVSALHDHVIGEQGFFTPDSSTAAAVGAANISATLFTTDISTRRFRFRCVEALPSALMLLRTAPASQRAKAIEQLLPLFEASVTNREALVHLDGWQLLLIACMFTDRHTRAWPVASRARSDSGASPAMLEFVNNSALETPRMIETAQLGVVGLLSTVVQHEILKEYGYRTLHTLVALAEAYQQQLAADVNRGIFAESSPYLFGVLLCTQVLTQLRTRLDTDVRHTPSLHPPLAQNISEILIFVDGLVAMAFPQQNQQNQQNQNQQDQNMPDQNQQENQTQQENQREQSLEDKIRPLTQLTDGVLCVTKAHLSSVLLFNEKGRANTCIGAITRILFRTIEECSYSDIAVQYIQALRQHCLETVCTTDSSSPMFGNWVVCIARFLWIYLVEGLRQLEQSQKSSVDEADTDCQLGNVSTANDIIITNDNEDTIDNENNPNQHGTDDNSNDPDDNNDTNNNNDNDNYNNDSDHDAETTITPRERESINNNTNNRQNSVVSKQRQWHIIGSVVNLLTDIFRPVQEQPRNLVSELSLPKLRSLCSSLAATVLALRDILRMRPRTLAACAPSLATSAVLAEGQNDDESSKLLGAGSVVEFAHAICAQHWHDTWFSNRVEREWKTLVVEGALHSLKRVRKAIGSNGIRDANSKAREVATNREKSGVEGLRKAYALCTRLASAETDRRDRRRRFENQRTAQIQRQWRKISDHICGDGMVWNSKHDSWCMGKHENAVRMRLLMKKDTATRPHHNKFKQQTKNDDNDDDNSNNNNTSSNTTETPKNQQQQQRHTRRLDVHQRHAGDRVLDFFPLSSQQSTPLPSSQQSPPTSPTLPSISLSNSNTSSSNLTTAQNPFSLLGNQQTAENYLLFPQQPQETQIGELNSGVLEMGLDVAPPVLLFRFECEWIRPELHLCGHLELTATTMTFFLNPSHPANKRLADRSIIINGFGNKIMNKQWQICDFVDVHQRRHLHKPTAIEVLTRSRKTIFLNFPDGNVRNVSRHILSSIKPVGITDVMRFGISVQDQQAILQRATQSWSEGEMTNFQYLMLINTLSGRSFNSLHTYPVFPWVLTDYVSPVLDLENKAVFRDLTKPMGALNKTRLQGFLERFNSMVEGEGLPPRFMYGTHYSNVGSVLFFLLRMEPFGTLAYDLGDGRLDKPDRLFWSIQSCWENNLTNPADVKELVPELFYLPEVLENSNHLAMGERQSGTVVDNVVLPPWAVDSYDFVRLHRMALESDYVSRNLHHWIDLIFGYKQRGVAAEEAHNVFYHLTYEDAVDVSKITDPVERASIEAQIESFGQCPSQLFTAPHPQRRVLPSHVTNVLPFPFSPSARYTLQSPHAIVLKMEGFTKICQNAILGTCVRPGAILTMQLVEGIICVSFHKWTTAVEKYHLRTLRSRESISDWENLANSSVSDLFDATAQTISANSQTTVLISSPITNLRFEGSVVTHSPQWWAGEGALISSNSSGDILCGGGFRDGSVLFWTPRGHVMVRHPMDMLVTCVAADEVEPNVFVCGGVDGVASTWFVENSSEGTVPTLCRCLFGHSSEITCIAVHADLDVCVSGSASGTVLIHRLQTGVVVRELPIDHSGTTVQAIRHVRVMDCGVVLVCTTNRLMSFSLNGRFLGRVDESYSAGIASICAPRASGVIFTAIGSDIVARDVLTLSISRKFSASSSSAICSLTTQGRWVFANHECGGVSVLGWEVNKHAY